MVYEMNDLKGILFLVLLKIISITSTNIDCSGNAFHCVNSTHFMICVDLGGGVSITIDDFIIPCPRATVCERNNSFECEYPKTVTTASPLGVTGVTKQEVIPIGSDGPETTLGYVTGLPDAINPVPTRTVTEEVTTLSNVEILDSVKLETDTNVESASEVMTINYSNTPNTIINENEITAHLKIKTSTHKSMFSPNNNIVKLESVIETVLGKPENKNIIKETLNGNITISDHNNNIKTIYDPTSSNNGTFTNKPQPGEDNLLESVYALTAKKQQNHQNNVNGNNVENHTQGLSIVNIDNDTKITEQAPSTTLSDILSTLNSNSMQNSTNFYPTTASTIIQSETTNTMTEYHGVNKTRITNGNSTETVLANDFITSQTTTETPFTGNILLIDQVNTLSTEATSNQYINLNSNLTIESVLYQRGNLNSETYPSLSTEKFASNFSGTQSGSNSDQGLTTTVIPLETTSNSLITEYHDDYATILSKENKTETLLPNEFRATEATLSDNVLATTPVRTFPSESTYLQDVGKIATTDVVHKSSYSNVSENYENTKGVLTSVDVTTNNKALETVTTERSTTKTSSLQTESKYDQTISSTKLSTTIIFGINKPVPYHNDSKKSKPVYANNIETISAKEFTTTTEIPYTDIVLLTDPTKTELAHIKDVYVENPLENIDLNTSENDMTIGFTYDKIVNKSTTEHALLRITNETHNFTINSSNMQTVTSFDRRSTTAVTTETSNNALVIDNQTRNADEFITTISSLSDIHLFTVPINTIPTEASINPDVNINTNPIKDLVNQSIHNKTRNEMYQIAKDNILTTNKTIETATSNQVLSTTLPEKRFDSKLNNTEQENYETRFNATILPLMETPTLNLITENHDLIEIKTMQEETHEIKTITEPYFTENGLTETDHVNKLSTEPANIQDVPINNITVEFEQFNKSDLNKQFNQVNEPINITLQFINDTLLNDTRTLEQDPIMVLSSTQTNNEPTVNITDYPLEITDYSKMKTTDKKLVTTSKSIITNNVLYKKEINITNSEIKNPIIQLNQTNRNNLNDALTTETSTSITEILVNKTGTTESPTLTTLTESYNSSSYIQQDRDQIVNVPTTQAEPIIPTFIPSYFHTSTVSFNQVNPTIELQVNHSERMIVQKELKQDFTKSNVISRTIKEIQNDTIPSTIGTDNLFEENLNTTRNIVDRNQNTSIIINIDTPSTLSTHTTILKTKYNLPEELKTTTETMFTENVTFIDEMYIETQEVVYEDILNKNTINAEPADQKHFQKLQDGLIDKINKGVARGIQNETHNFTINSSNMQTVTSFDRRSTTAVTTETSNNALVIDNQTRNADEFITTISSLSDINLFTEPINTIPTEASINPDVNINTNPIKDLVNQSIHNKTRDEMYQIAKDNFLTTNKTIETATSNQVLSTTLAEKRFDSKLNNTEQENYETRFIATILSSMETPTLNLITENHDLIETKTMQEETHEIKTITEPYFTENGLTETDQVNKLSTEPTNIQDVPINNITVEFEQFNKSELNKQFNQVNEPINITLQFINDTLLNDTRTLEQDPIMILSSTQTNNEPTVNITDYPLEITDYSKMKTTDKKLVTTSKSIITNNVLYKKEINITNSEIKNPIIQLNQTNRNNLNDALTTETSTSITEILVNKTGTTESPTLTTLTESYNSSSYIQQHRDQIVNVPTTQAEPIVPTFIPSYFHTSTVSFSQVNPTIELQVNHSERMIVQKELKQDFTKSNVTSRTIKEIQNDTIPSTIGTDNLFEANLNTTRNIVDRNQNTSIIINIDTPSTLSTHTTILKTKYNLPEELKTTTATMFTENVTFIDEMYIETQEVVYEDILNKNTINAEPADQKHFQKLQDGLINKINKGVARGIQNETHNFTINSSNMQTVTSFDRQSTTAVTTETSNNALVIDNQTRNADEFITTISSLSDINLFTEPINTIPTEASINPDVNINTNPIKDLVNQSIHNKTRNEMYQIAKDNFLTTSKTIETATSNKVLSTNLTEKRFDSKLNNSEQENYETRFIATILPSLETPTLNLITENHDLIETKTMQEETHEIKTTTDPYFTENGLTKSDHVKKLSTEPTNIQDVPINNITVEFEQFNKSELNKQFNQVNEPINITLQFINDTLLNDTRTLEQDHIMILSSTQTNNEPTVNITDYPLEITDYSEMKTTDKNLVTTSKSIITNNVLYKKEINIANSEIKNPIIQLNQTNLNNLNDALSTETSTLITEILVNKTGTTDSPTLTTLTESYNSSYYIQQDRDQIVNVPTTQAEPIIPTFIPSYFHTSTVSFNQVNPTIELQVNHSERMIVQKELKQDFTKSNVISRTIKEIQNDTIPSTIGTDNLFEENLNTTRNIVDRNQNTSIIINIDTPSTLSTHTTILKTKYNLPEEFKTTTETMFTENVTFIDEMHIETQEVVYEDILNKNTSNAEPAEKQFQKLQDGLIDKINKGVGGGIQNELPITEISITQGITLTPTKSVYNDLIGLSSTRLVKFEELQTEKSNAVIASTTQHNIFQSDDISLLSNIEKVGKFVTLLPMESITDKANETIIKLRTDNNFEPVQNNTPIFPTVLGEILNIPTSTAQFKTSSNQFIIDYPEDIINATKINTFEPHIDNIQLTMQMTQATATSNLLEEIFLENRTEHPFTMSYPIIIANPSSESNSFYPSTHSNINNILAKNKSDLQIITLDTTLNLHDSGIDNTGNAITPETIVENSSNINPSTENITDVPTNLSVSNIVEEPTERKYTNVYFVDVSSLDVRDNAVRDSTLKMEMVTETVGAFSVDDNKLNIAKLNNCTSNSETQNLNNNVIANKATDKCILDIMNKPRDSSNTNTNYSSITDNLFSVGHNIPTVEELPRSLANSTTLRLMSGAYKNVTYLESSLTTPPRQMLPLPALDIKSTKSNQTIHKSPNNLLNASKDSISTGTLEPIEYLKSTKYLDKGEYAPIKRSNTPKEDDIRSQIAYKIQEAKNINNSSVSTSTLVIANVNSSEPLYQQGDLKEQVRTINNKNASELENNKQPNHTINTKNLKVNITTNGNLANTNISNDNIVNVFQFNCTKRSRGKYANNKDCRKFYICIGRAQPLMGKCPRNTVFSEINKQCTRNLSHCVRNNQFRCLLEGRFSDFFKDNVYYICVRKSINNFMRYQLQCQSGFHLNKDTVRCEPNIEILSVSASSVSDNSQKSNDYSESKQNTEQNQEASSTGSFECEKEGKFPYPDDCRKYYVCSKNRKAEYRRKIKHCSSDEVFHNEKKKCVESESYGC